MKAFFSIILALAIAAPIGSIQAGPVQRAVNVAKITVKKANYVGHQVVRGTRRAVHNTVDRLTR